MNTAYKDLICTSKEIAEACNMSIKNFRKTYIRTDSDPKEKKQGMLECMDMGAFCKKNGVTPRELEIIVNLSKEIKLQVLKKVQGIEL